jgi:hypothetical protein
VSVVTLLLALVAGALLYQVLIIVAAIRYRGVRPPLMGAVPDCALFPQRPFFRSGRSRISATWAATAAEAPKSPRQLWRILRAVESFRRAG